VWWDDEWTRKHEANEKHESEKAGKKQNRNGRTPPAPFMFFICFMFSCWNFPLI
jgi:hypothetical protein